MDYKVKPQKPQPGVQVQVIGAGEYDVLVAFWTFHFLEINLGRSS